jgi:precorrin-8X/cobalt-precorrin-8 methylmutase
MNYLRDPEAIYRESFATIEREADLTRFTPTERRVAVRLIHACGMPDIAAALVFSTGAVEAGRAALAAGAPVICDSNMVRHGIIAARLPANNELLCGLDHETSNGSDTRSAAGLEALRERIPGCVVAIGNAPTALFRLLELLDARLPPPALILGFPVGFVGAAESKAELVANSRGVPFIALKGRRGGSALAAAAVNALADGTA